jgi:SAM-dependent methyltransferase
MAEPFNSSRARLRDEVASFASTIAPGALILDAGAGTSPYKTFFAHARYESADFEQVTKTYAPQSYTCDLSRIPVEDERFDAVIFNQVMEHLPDPLAVLRELRRVLKRDGRLFCSAPLFYEEHEQPYDFFRYTQFGFRHLFTQASLDIVRLDWLEGYYGTFGYQCATAADALPRRPRQYGGGLTGLMAGAMVTALRPGLRGLSRFMHRLEMRHKFTVRGYPKNYVVIARRAAP